MKLVQLKFSEFKIAIVLSLFFLFVSCNNKDGINGEAVIDAVPFVVNNVNSYRWSATYDSAGIITQSFADSFRVQVKSNSETVNGINNLTLVEASKLNSNTTLQKVWYRITKDTLTEIGYQFNAGADIPGISIFPKQSSYGNTGSMIFVPRTLRMLLKKKYAFDSLMLREDARIVYQYPLTVGKKWTSFRTPFLQTREVVGTEMIRVRAGDYLCLKIRSTIEFPFSEPLEYFDYVAHDGLILRTFKDRFVMTNESNPDGIGVFSSVDERLELISRN
jgi:hypothetical protein